MKMMNANDVREAIIHRHVERHLKKLNSCLCMMARNGKQFKFRIKNVGELHSLICSEVVSVLNGAAFKTKTETRGNCYVITVSL
jgi:hypothetical protein